MKKIMLFIFSCLIMQNNLHAIRFDSIVNVENNSDTAYYGGYRTISSHNNSYVPVNLPLNLAPKYDKSKPSFKIIEGFESNAQCGTDETSYIYRVMASDGNKYDFPQCVPSYKRAFIYVTINKDYSVSLKFDYGISYYTGLFYHLLGRK